MCSLDGGADRPTGRGNFGVDMGWSIVTNGEFVATLYYVRTRAAIYSIEIHVFVINYYHQSSLTVAIIVD